MVERRDSVHRLSGFVLDSRYLPGKKFEILRQLRFDPQPPLHFRLEYFLCL